MQKRSKVLFGVVLIGHMAGLLALGLEDSVEAALEQALNKTSSKDNAINNRGFLRIDFPFSAD